MVHTRAETTQIDAWEEVGNQGWNWDALFPYYKKSQHLISPGQRATKAGDSYNPSFHGFQGPVNTGWPRFELVSKYLPLTQRELCEFRGSLEGRLSRRRNTWIWCEFRLSQLSKETLTMATIS